MLEKISPQQDDLFENMRESHFEKRKPLASLLIAAYNCRGRANERLQDYQQALSDYNKLLELCQFQDLPTAKVFEYMTVRSAIMNKLEAGNQSLSIRQHDTSSMIANPLTPIKKT